MKQRLRLFLVVNKTKPAAVRAAAEVADWCRAHGVPCADTELQGDVTAGDVVCALGGDGTVLRAAAIAADRGAAVLGVDVGSLGFLAQTPLDGLLPALERLARGDYEVEARMRLRYRSGEADGTALNDLVVSGLGRRLLELRLDWQGSPATTLLGDGIVVSTPTGTTAYNLSLGGPIVAPTASCLVVTPHAAHVLGGRPVVFAADDELRVRVLGEARLVADGDEVGRVPAGVDITVSRAAAPTLLVRAAGAPGFFSTLSRKLNWPTVDSRRG